MRKSNNKGHHFTKKKLKKILVIELILLVVFCGVTGASAQAVQTGQEQQISAEKTANAFDYLTPRHIRKVAYELVDNGRRKLRQIWRDGIRRKARAMKFVAQERSSGIEKTETYKLVQGTFSWGGARISPSAGSVTGPSGKETYYNLDMSTCVSNLKGMGYNGSYWVRSDGCKMFGNYIMVAANLSKHPKGSIVKCSRGLAIVADTGGFAKNNPNQLDIATNW